MILSFSALQNTLCLSHTHKHNFSPLFICNEPASLDWIYILFCFHFGMAALQDCSLNLSFLLHWVIYQNHFYIYKYVWFDFLLSVFYVFCPLGSHLHLLPEIISREQKNSNQKAPQSRKSAEIGGPNTSNIKLDVVGGCLAVSVNLIHYNHIHFV